jgi:DNA-binding SARP family transcriptional activator
MERVWSFQMLGRFRLTQGERSIGRFRTLKAAGVLAYLAVHRHRSHPRETLIEIFWPEAEPDSGRHSLSLALSSLRHQLEPPGVPAGSVIVADRSSVELNPDAFTTDVMEFEQALRLAARAPEEGQKERHLAGAVERYAGPLLPGFYEEWVLNEQARLAERFVQAVRQLLDLMSRRGDPVQALELARRAIAVDPLREDLHADLMRFLMAGGQPAAPLAQYRELERLLAEELGETPGPAVQCLARQLERGEDRQALAKELPEEIAALVKSPRTPTSSSSGTPSLSKTPTGSSCASRSRWRPPAAPSRIGTSCACAAAERRSGAAPCACSRSAWVTTRTCRSCGTPRPMRGRWRTRSARRRGRRTTTGSTAALRPSPWSSRTPRSSASGRRSTGW